MMTTQTRLLFSTMHSVLCVTFYVFVFVLADIVMRILKHILNISNVTIIKGELEAIAPFEFCSFQ